MTLLDMYQTLTNNICKAKGVNPNNVFEVTALALKMNEEDCTEEELKEVKSELFKMTQRKPGQEIVVPSFLKDYISRRKQS